mgnify:CR=1 FL=1
MEQANKYIKNIINTQRTFFNSNKTKDITFRKKMLCKLKKAIKHNEKKILRALYHDLGKSKEDGEKVAVELAKEIISYIDDFADGYYFSFPFNRVYLLNRILG